jgi:flagellar biosynthesis regulator FlaF
MTTRDNFSETTKRTLAIRASHFCSNPHCLKLTAGPHSDETKSLSTGHAAHIHAASPKGPRYDTNQTPAQRKAISNGLWLCRECGDIVDKDDASHSPDLLRQWKSDHEAMIAEVRTKGYARSLALLQSRHIEPAIAKKIISALEDRRALWQTFDAEFPDRVRQSLDHLRSRFVDLRSEVADGSPMDQILLSLTKTIHVFFNAVERSDLTRLRCDSNDPEWCRFNDALATLRKAVGFQIFNLASVYTVALSSDLQSIAPQ